MLKFLCANCNHIVKADVHFVDERLCPGYTDLINRDLEELTNCVSHGPSKSALLIVGSIFEATFYCFLKRNEHYMIWVSNNPGFEIRNDKDTWLLNYLQILRRYFGVYDLDIFPDEIISYRNLIHPAFEIRENVRISDSEVRQAVIHLNRALREFEQFAY